MRFSSILKQKRGSSWQLQEKKSLSSAAFLSSRYQSFLTNKMRLFVLILETTSVVSLSSLIHHRLWSQTWLNFSSKQVHRMFKCKTKMLCHNCRAWKVYYNLLLSKSHVRTTCHRVATFKQPVAGCNRDRWVEWGVWYGPCMQHAWFMGRPPSEEGGRFLLLSALICSSSGGGLRFNTSCTVRTPSVFFALESKEMGRGFEGGVLAGLSQDSFLPPSPFFILLQWSFISPLSKDSRPCIKWEMAFMQVGVLDGER